MAVCSGSVLWQCVGAGVGAGVELSTEAKMWVGLGYLACIQTRCMECKQVYKVWL